MKTCSVCLQDSFAIESHHIHPTSLGGSKEGPQVDLCSSCHRLIHQQALKLTSKDHKKRIERVIPPENWARAVPLIGYIIRSIMVTNDGKKNAQGKDVKMILSIPKWMNLRLHAKKQDAGFKNLQTYILEVLRQHVQSM
jgi:hypothetical protein